MLKNEQHTENKRITLVSLIDSNEINKIENLLKVINEKICKVPYGIDNKNRYNIDNLPFHITIFATNKANENKMLNLMKNLNIGKIKVHINQVKIMNGRENSYVLYLSIKENEKLKSLQSIFYNEFHSEAYNPNNFIFHITLHIDKQYEKILKMKEKLISNFEPFDIEFNKLGLYNYPGNILDKACF